MNYEERKQILNKDDIESEKDVNNQEEDNKTILKTVKSYMA